MAEEITSADVTGSSLLIEADGYSPPLIDDTVPGSSLIISGKIFLVGRYVTLPAVCVGAIDITSVHPSAPELVAVHDDEIDLAGVA
jgi:hypothetical protein